MKGGPSSAEPPDDRAKNSLLGWCLGYLTSPWAKTLAFVVGFAIYVRAFDWRNCGVTVHTDGATDLFSPPDGMFGYDAGELTELFGAVSDAGRSLYAGSQWYLDLPFPVFYALALILVLRRVVPEDHRYRPLATILPLMAAGADVLENTALTWIALSGSFTGALTGAASALTKGKWVLLVASLLFALIGFIVWHRRHSRLLAQHLFFIRVPLLAGIGVIALAFAGRSQTCAADGAPPVGLATVRNLLTLENTVQYGYAVFFIFIGVSIVIFCGTHLWRLAHMRINTKPFWLRAIPRNDVDTHAKFCISGIVAALPLLMMLRLEGSGWAIAAWAIGLSAGVLLLVIVFAVRSGLTNPDSRVSGLFGQLRQRSIDAEPRASRALDRALGPGFEEKGRRNRSTGRLLRGHPLALAIFFVLLALYLALGPLLNPTNALPDILNVPPISYIMLLLALICMLFSALTFVLDRVRVPLLLALAGWIVLFGNIPGWWDTQHYFDVTFVPEGDDGPPSIDDAFDARARHTGQGPIVVVAAAGGGIQAAAWTTEVLTGLTEALGPEFVDSIHLISATSGGSVGTYFFVEALRAEASASGRPMVRGTEGPDAATSRSRYTGFATAPDRLSAIRKTLSARDKARAERGDWPTGRSLPPTGVRYLEQAPKAAMASSLEATAWGLVFPDLQRLIAPFFVWSSERRTERDRAWAIEQAWHRWRTCMTTDTTADHYDMEENPDCRQSLNGGPPPARLSDWWADAASGALPGIILNGTFIDDGEQFLASNLDLRALDLSRGGASFAQPNRWTLGGFDPSLCEHYPPKPTDVRADEIGVGGRTHPSAADQSPAIRASLAKTRDKAGTRSGDPDPCGRPMRFVDMRAVTAARLSATFPYVTPVARARVRRAHRATRGDQGNPQTEPADNAREVDTQPWHVGDGGYFDNPGSVAAIRWIEVVRELAPRRPILFIQINPFPAVPNREPPEEGQGWQASLVGPIKGMLKVRTSSQLARSDFELSMIGDCFEAVEFRPPYVLNREDPPLSWELSRADRQRIASDWRDDSNRDTVAYLRQQYFNGRAPGCRE